MSSWMGVLPNEVRFALRSFVNRPGFSAVAIATLALGVGANTAIFSVVNGVLLKPLGYPDPENLVTVDAEWFGPEPGVGSMSYPDMLDLETEVAAFESLVGVNTTDMTLTGINEPVVMGVTRVTKGLMETFRVAPAMGRDIRSDEFGHSGPPVVVVSYAFWQSRLGGDSDVLARTLQLSGVEYEIVGVAPPGFDYPEASELWVPRHLDLEGCGRGCHTMHVVGRLLAGVSLGEARAEADHLAASLGQEYPDTNTYKRFLVRSLQDRMVGDVRAGLLLMLGAVGLVALIACANVANLMLARASSRVGEIAIRTAIGASRARLVVLSLLESGILALLGGMAGLALATAGLFWLPRLAPNLPRGGDVVIDANVLLFTFGTVVIVTLVFGLAPAFALARTPVRFGLGRAASGGESAERRRFRALLLGGEVALSACLLVGAGLLLKSFSALYAVDVGFETRNISRFNVVLPEVRYESLSAIRVFYRELEERIRVLPGVESVGSVWGPPLGRGRATGTVYVDGRPDPTPELEREASIHSVSPGWFETMRIPLRRGHLLEVGDDVGPEPVALVNEAFVRENFPSEDPIGRIVRVSVDLGYGSPHWRLVGIVGDVRARSLEEAAEAQIYVPHGLYGPEDMTVSIRTRPGARPVLPEVRAILHEMDAAVPMYQVETIDQALARQLAPTRFYLVLNGAFAAVAVLLAAVGLYGVVAYNTSRRTRELGLRMALGAREQGILTMVLLQAMVPALTGLAVGLAGAFFAGRLMNAILFGVEPTDAAIYVATSVILTAVALIATAVPARRASRLDPAVALRLT
ncbi:MAG TPA: ABC transporter permease [Vicinamibacteria bacterium]|nr:ABC transporter permease [Vicinamibacteria bacterium]